MEGYMPPAGRSNAAEIETEVQRFSANPLADGLLVLTRGLLAILDENRQIIAANHALLNFLGIDRPEEALGIRPGEALRCLHAESGSDGCGTSPYCSSCGAAIAIVAAQRDNAPAERMCAVTVLRQGRKADLFFKVMARPVTVSGRDYMLFYLEDHTRQQQLEALESVFFHDLSNILSVLVGKSDLLALKAEADFRRDAQEIGRFTERMAREIQIQRLFADGGYQMKSAVEEFSVDRVIGEIDSIFSAFSSPKKFRFELVGDVAGITLSTDFFLLTRVLINMVKNAMETCQEEEVILCRVKKCVDRLVFEVWNRQEIDETIGKRIFQRNFSTKGGRGRGLGTFSMKLFGEQYLGGRVYFTTSASQGTSFFLDLPLN